MILLYFFPSIYFCINGIMAQVGIRYGHFYAYTLVDQLSPKIDIDGGVVRISLVHYNTVEEVERIIEILKEVFAQDDLSVALKERTTSGY